MRLSFEERLSGAYRVGDCPDRPLRLELVGKWRPFHAQFEASGSISAPGLVERAEVHGTITYGRPSSLTYDLHFEDERGARYRLIADKRNLLDDAYAGFTTLGGRLIDERRRERVAWIGARFDARGDLGWWLSRLKLSMS